MYKSSVTSAHEISTYFDTIINKTAASLDRVGFLPWQKVFLPGQSKKTVITGKNFSTLYGINIQRSNYNAPLILGTS